MVRELRSGPMEGATRASFKTVRDTDRGYLPGMTVESILASGLLENSMEREYTLTKRVRHAKVLGKMVNG